MSPCQMMICSDIARFTYYVSAVKILLLQFLIQTFCRHLILCTLFTCVELPEGGDSTKINK